MLLQFLNFSFYYFLIVSSRICWYLSNVWHTVRPKAQHYILFPSGNRALMWWHISQYNFVTYIPLWDIYLNIYVTSQCDICLNIYVTYIPICDIYPNMWHIYPNIRIKNLMFLCCWIKTKSCPTLVAVAMKINSPWGLKLLFFLLLAPL